MRIMKWGLRIILMQFIIAVSMTELFVKFFTGISVVIFRLLSGILLLTATLSFGFGVKDGWECVLMVLSGFLFYLLPCLADVAVTVICLIKYGIRKICI